MQNVYKKCFKKVVMLLRMILLLFYNDASNFADFILLSSCVFVCSYELSLQFLGKQCLVNRVTLFFNKQFLHTNNR